MARISALLLAVTFLFAGLQAFAADGDTLTCALTKATECTPQEGCTEWTIQDMALPRFVRIDLASKTMTSLDKEVPRTSKIASVERLEGFIVMHGTEQRGWTMAIGEKTGVLTLCAAGDSEGFVVFGSCFTP